MLTAISSGVESLLNWADGASESSLTNVFLHGNFGPVKDEFQVSNLPIVGTVPEYGHGTYLRTGPNPCLPPTGDYHWFDGDGMIHVVTISKNSEGKSVASYTRRYVKTHRLRQETEAGRPLFLKIGDTWGRLAMMKAINLVGREMVGIVDASNGEGTANTNIISVKSGDNKWRLFALQEQDLPYEMKLTESGDVETVGRLSSSESDKIKYASPLYTAHPKTLYHPHNNDDDDLLIAFAYGVDPRVHPLTYHRHRLKDMTLMESCPVDLGRANGSMMHDFAVTRKYAVFFDLPLIFDLANMISIGSAVSFVKTMPSRFGFAPLVDYVARSAISPLWIETDPCYIFHLIAAWDDEETDCVVNIIACRMDEIDLKVVVSTSLLDVPKPCLFQFNLMTSTCRWKNIISSSAIFSSSYFSSSSSSSSSACYNAGVDDVEFPIIHPDLNGHPPSVVKFAYAGVFKHESRLESAGIIKFDLRKASFDKDNCNDFVVDFLPYGEHKRGGEAFFVPKMRFSGDGGDEGLLVVFVYDQESGDSSFVAYDAATMNPEPVFSVSLPVRVPYGFHGTWVPAA